MDNEYGSIIDPYKQNLTPLGIKGTRLCNKETNEMLSIGPSSDLYVFVPRLKAHKIIVPNTFCITFDLLLSGDASNTIVNNVVKSIFKKIKFIIGDKEIFELNGLDVYSIFKDLFLSKLDRENMIYEGIQDDKLRKLRISPQTKPPETDSTAVAISKIFKNRYRYYFDIDFFKVPICPYLIEQKMRIELELNDVSRIIKTNTTKDWDYKLDNIKVEFETFSNETVISTIEDKYQYQFTFYNYDISLSEKPKLKESDTTFNIKVKVYRKNLCGILLLFKQSFTDGAYDSEHFVNPKITKADIKINNDSAFIYNSSMTALDQYDEILRFFNSKNPSVSFTDFYAGNKFGFFLDTRSNADNSLHGSGLETDDLMIEFQKENTGSGELDMYVYLIAHSHFTIENYKPTSLVK